MVLFKLSLTQHILVNCSQEACFEISCNFGDDTETWPTMSAMVQTDAGRVTRPAGLGRRHAVREE